MKRDGFDKTLEWSMVASATTLLLVTAIAWPLAYIWIMATVGCLAVACVTMTIAGSLSSGGGFFSWYFSMKIIEAGFEVILAILTSVAKISE